jgi:hypothetical protein
MIVVLPYISHIFPPISEAVLSVCVGTCVTLLAAALIVLSLVNLQSSSSGFSLDVEVRRDRALLVVKNVKVTVWTAGLGALDGLVALTWSQAPLRWVAVILTFFATAAFLGMSARTVVTVVSANSRDVK